MGPLLPCSPTILIISIQPDMILPGNIWHFYGRIAATKQVGIKVEVAILSVLIEPLLMAAAALAIALVAATQ